MSVYEMVGAYATFANKGVWTEPIFVTRIVDKDGNELARFDAESREVFSEETAYVMTKMLEGVVNRGTAARLRGKYGLRRPIGGKTGTTQNNSDGWFVGVTPGLAMGAWVGADDRAVHFRSTSLGGGSNSALPIVGEFLTRIWGDKNIDLPVRYFEAPEAGTISISCE
jgi:penicillin-binding protein 1A